MKKKIFGKGMTRRRFSVVLVLAIIIGLMPVNSITAYAATEWQEYSGYGKTFWYDPEYVVNESDDVHIHYYCDVCEDPKGVFQWNNESGWVAAVTCPHIVTKAPTGSPSHTHGSWSYVVENTSTLKATCGSDGCDETPYSVSLDLTASSANYSGTAISKSVIFDSTDFDAFNGATGNNISVDNIKLYKSEDTSKEHEFTEIIASGSYVAELTIGEITVTCNLLITGMTYTITIPATVSVDKEGFNAFGDGIKICNLQNSDADMDGLMVSAASANDWKLVKDSNSVRYGLRESEASESDVLEFKFAKGDIISETGKIIACGVFINAEDFENAPEGDYTDTITWTISKYQD